MVDEAADGFSGGFSRVVAVPPANPTCQSLRNAFDTVKTLYNDTVFFADRIVIPKVSLYSDFARKTH